MSRYLIFLIFLISTQTFAQKVNGINLPVKAMSKKCNKCLSLLSQKPIDIQMGIQREGDELIFLTNNRAWLFELFDGNYDGIMIDVISKKSFPCGSKKVFTGNDLIRGVALPPVFKKDFKDKLIISPEGYITFKAGTIPIDIISEELEYNIIFVQDKNYCSYQTFYDITDHKWELLEMGLYADSLQQQSEIEKIIERNKGLKFELYFEKNKADYKMEDVQPIYDSLSLYNYDIKSVKIEAYSSIEGDRENNKLLQQRRAESIVSVLERIQHQTIPSEIVTSENWVDFFNDLKNTPYSSWASLNKRSIKKRLEDKKISDRLEPVLQKHRKAILYLQLEKKIKVNYENKAELISLFDQVVKDKNIDEANRIQRYVYQSIKNEQLPSEFLDKLEIPMSNDYGVLLNNKIVYEHSLAPQYIYSSLAAFQKLDALIPNNKKIKYNIIALSIKAWSFDDPMVEREALLTGINRLKQLGIHQSLITRLRINYNILLSEELQRKGSYKAKDKIVRHTYSIYRNLTMSQEDVLSVAKYFVSYQKYQWATSLLKPYINNVQTNEDVLFYYINLTIIDPKAIKSSTYRALISNAINKNANRFCSLFKPALEGGVTFQLLNNLFLRREYCDHCPENIDLY